MRFLLSIVNFVLGCAILIGGFIAFIAGGVALMIIWQYKWWVSLGLVAVITTAAALSKNPESKLAERTTVGFKAGLVMAALFLGIGAVVQSCSSSRSNCYTEWDGRGNPTYCE